MGITQSELQLLDRSPVQTPAHTRANTPVNDMVSSSKDLISLNDISGSLDTVMKENTVYLQHLDRSPTQTPYQTRANSLGNGKAGIAPSAATGEELDLTLKVVWERLGGLEDGKSDKEAKEGEQKEEALKKELGEK